MEGVPLLKKSIQSLASNLHSICDSSLLASLYSHIGLDYHYISNYELAIEYLEKNLRINEKIADVGQMALAHSNLVLPLLKIGAIDKALKHGQKANCIWQQIGYPKGFNDMFWTAQMNYATATYEKGKAHYYRSELGQGVNLLHESLNTYRKIAEIIAADSSLTPAEQKELTIYNLSLIHI